MDVNGCHVVSEPTDKNAEGFSTTVLRDGVLRGPFATISEAVQCALTWTASTNEAVQVEAKVENPSVIEAT